MRIESYISSVCAPVCPRITGEIGQSPQFPQMVPYLLFVIQQQKGSCHRAIPVHPPGWRVVLRVSQYSARQLDTERTGETSSVQMALLGINPLQYIAKVDLWNVGLADWASPPSTGSPVMVFVVGPEPKSAARFASLRGYSIEPITCNLNLWIVVGALKPMGLAMAGFSRFRVLRI